MRFRRLKLSGFKSFVEPAELHIEPGLTGVVGPNGCGKSNLLEAIRWVMGESSPKSLRGGGMEDVIFAGTAQRPARDFAEVVLSAEASAGGADNDGEFEIVRRIERGAGSAYRINGRDVRQKDVSLLFADAATGAHSPALVSQGRIAAVIAARPAERRQMLEEAAGISGLHVRRRDAEARLRGTEANLARLDDLLAGLDSQIAGLRRQARAAERYKAISEQVRLAEARLVFARWRDAAADAERAQGEAELAARAVAEAQSATRTAQDAQAVAALALAQAREDLADRRQDSAAHGHLLTSLTTRLDTVEDRLRDLDRQLARLEDDQGHADRMTGDAAAALARLEREGAAAQATLAGEESRRPAALAAQENAERASRAAELALANAVAEQAGLDAEWRVAEAAVAAATGRRDRVLADEARRRAEAAALDGQGDPALAVAEAQAAVERAAQAVASAREVRAAMDGARDALVAARDAGGDALAAARAERATAESEHRALARDKAARAARGGNKGQRTAIGSVRVTAGYERALAAVLGRDAQAPLGPDPGRDGRFWTGAPAIPAALPDSLAAHVAGAPELAARLALVRFAEQDDARALAPGEWLVTRDGALRRWDGFVARGEGGAEAAVLAADNRLEELAQRLPALVAAEESAAADLARATADLTDHGARAAQADRALASASEAERTALRALDQAEGAMARIARQREEIAAALADIARQRETAETEVAAAFDKRTALPDPEAGRRTVETARARNDAARQAMQAAMATFSALEQGLAVARERHSAIVAEVAGWRDRASDAARRLADMTRRREELGEERAIIAAKPESLRHEIEQAESIRDRLTGECSAAETALAAAEEAARGADAELVRRNEVLSDVREARAGAAARAESQVQRREEASRLSGERFQCPPPLLPERFAFTSAEIARAEDEQATHDRLIAERERLGPVNLVAAEELSVAEARHGENLAEKEELAEAVHRLRGSIGALNREGRERLRAAFEAVDGHFRRLFTRLFDGGQAHLAMVDSDDPLEAGLEIFAQPPGKKLQSLTLASGGEQALTAVALIFALFLTNPAPICVLDEVDAPLDDANIERFCDLLDAMGGETDTRFLIVTHNAVTMSRMHRLFGVTMVEQGVSRLVSVDLSAAEKLVA